MALMKFEQLSLDQLAGVDSAAGNQAKLTHFFDKLTAYYNALGSEQEKRNFLHKLLAWNENQDVTKRQNLFLHAYNLDHKEALAILMKTRAYTGTIYTTSPQKNYFQHLEATFLTPIRIALGKALAKTLLIPDLQKIILNYVQAPIQGAIPLEEKPEAKSEAKKEGPKVVVQPVEATQPVESVEATLGKKNLKKAQDEARNRFFFSLFCEFFLGLLWLALYIAVVAVLTVCLDFLPVIPVVFLSLALIGVLFTSGILSVPALLEPIFTLCTVLSPSNRAACGPRAMYEAGTKLNDKIIKKALIGLALISAMALALGVLSLLPPLGLAIPVLACTIAAGLALTGSVSALSFFGCKMQKEKKEAAKFESAIGYFAQDPAPVAPGP